MARRALFEAGVSRRHARERRRVVDRSRVVRTTTFRPAEERCSRRAGHPTPGREVTPLVFFVEWMFVIYGVARVDLSAAMARKQRRKGFVEKSRVGAPRTKSASGVEKIGIDGGTDTYAWHATIMPLISGVETALSAEKCEWRPRPARYQRSWLPPKALTNSGTSRRCVSRTLTQVSASAARIAAMSCWCSLSMVDSRPGASIMVRVPSRT